MENKKRKIKEKTELKAISLFEIILLVVATIAFSWMIGSQIETVSADTSGGSDEGCILLGGICTTNSYSPITGEPCNSGSWAGTFKTGLCSGDSKRVCCVPNSDTTPEPEDDGKNFMDTGVGKIATTVVTAATTDIATEAFRNYLQNSQFGSKLGFGPKTGTPTGIGGINSPLYTGSLPGGPTSTSATGIGGINSPLYTDSLPGGPTSPTGFFSGNTGTLSGILGQVLLNAAAAAGTALIINYFAKKFASDRNFNDIKLITWLSVAPAAGIGLIGMNVLPLLASMGIAAGFVALAFVAYMLVGYQIYSRDSYTYRVSMWQAPIGGDDCNKCNSLTVGLGENKVSGCSEYICHTYGAACIFMNSNTDYEVCTVGNPNDGAAPHIEPAREINGEDVFPTSQYNYRTSAAAAQIIYTGADGGVNQCVPAYTPITIALKTQEEADCRISLDETTGTPQEAFQSMLPMAEGTVYTKNHTVKLPSSVTATQEALENAGYTINNGGNYKFYIRCSDYWGNINSVDYSIGFCVQMGPDRRPPEIVSTNPETESYIKYDTTFIEDFQVYTDEPADCKWDTRRVSYNYMTYNFSKCSQRIDDYIAGFDYGCRTNLTQFQRGDENRYYIACRDKPEYKGNVTKEAQRNTGEPYEVVLKGTNRLMIQNVRINGKQNGTEIRSASDNSNVKLEVFTSNGAEDGKAKCMYSINSNDDSSYSLFSNEGNLEYLTTNTEEFYMPAGLYNTNIKCIDLAENIAETMVNFSVEVDLMSPAVVRVYKDEASDSLKIITDENAECVYSTTTCTYNIDEGTAIETEDGINHYIEWDTERDLYIKCADEYGNYPYEGSCSIIVRPFEIAQVI